MVNEIVFPVHPYPVLSFTADSIVTYLDNLDAIASFFVRDPEFVLAYLHIHLPGVLHPSFDGLQDK